VSNWFESNPTRTVIIHTFLVATAVWAFFVFVFDENKVAAYRAEVENEKATASQYKAKTEVLEVEIARLREESRKYLEWMVNTPNTIPYLEQRIKTLTDENNRQKAQLAAVAKVEPSGTPSLTTIPYSNTKLLNIGEAFIDPRTNATLGIGKIAPDFTANIVLNVPGEKARELPQAKAGETWKFTKGDKYYQLTLSKVDWFTNKAEVQLRELEEKQKPPASRATR
jgi:hypothetical protein